MNVFNSLYDIKLWDCEDDITYNLMSPFFKYDKETQKYYLLIDCNDNEMNEHFNKAEVFNKDVDIISYLIKTYKYNIYIYKH